MPRVILSFAVPHPMYDLATYHNKSWRITAGKELQNVKAQDVTCLMVGYLYRLGNSLILS